MYKKYFLKLIYMCIILINMSGCSIQSTNKFILQDNNIEKTNEEKITFKESSIPLSIQKKMHGKSMKENAYIKYEDLAYVQVSYINFEGETKLGELIVNKNVSSEIVDIFKELYEKKYPIAKISLIDDYNGNDEESMLANNTSAFNYRTIAGTNYLSNHAKGYAIDINPFQNPHVTGKETSPAAAWEYKDRTSIEKGMIVEGDDCYKAFISRGWQWGGHWKNPDYQHFEKQVN